MFEAHILTATFTDCCMRVGLVQGRIVSPVLFRLYVNDMHVPSCHFQLALYAEDAAIIATTPKSALHIRYVETFLSDLERWPREWRIAIKVSKSNAMVSAKAAWRVTRTQPVQSLGQTIEWDGTAPYLGVTIDSRLT
jgi:hypothetical protein